ncbi:uncharacterized protein LOC124819722 [Vigna umbellata]|uniref:uncharacterized protein LOC124819722 n=1 Tax=Vigna umbellata TaxID=87088 RepID=UPI001F5F7D55|nr:uncharacterized protein LOC124819722 [Vigna umbellata]
MTQMKNSPTHWSKAEPDHFRVPSKVVSIPVYFVGSERTRTDSAIKIQRMLRGFLVRNAMKKIAAMRVELERIESGIRMEVLRREQKERVRVIETIMNLLLRLDSVRVLHYSGLRECRKSVIKKAIAVQEMLDEMSVPASEKEEEEEVKKEREGDCGVGEDEGNVMESLQNESGCMEEESIEFETSLVEGKEGEVICDEQEKIEGLRSEEVEDGEEGKSLVKEEKGDCEREEGDGKKMELLLEKLVEDKQNMMEMMVQLFQRNETQTILLTSLSQRVEQLERAFVSEKLRRKKKSKADVKKKYSCPKNGFH